MLDSSDSLQNNIETPRYPTFSEPAQLYSAESETQNREDERRKKAEVALLVVYNSIAILPRLW